MDVECGDHDKGEILWAVNPSLFSTHYRADKLARSCNTTLQLYQAKIDQGHSLLIRKSPFLPSVRTRSDTVGTS